MIAVEKMVVGQKTSGSTPSSNLRQCWTTRDSEGGRVEGGGRSIPPTAVQRPPHEGNSKLHRTVVTAPPPSSQKSPARNLANRAFEFSFTELTWFLQGLCR
jgi:hypothetical protein